LNQQQKEMEAANANVQDWIAHSCKAVRPHNSTRWVVPGLHLLTAVVEMQLGEAVKTKQPFGSHHPCCLLALLSNS
jgi:hypothetical protein